MRKLIYSVLFAYLSLALLPLKPLWAGSPGHTPIIYKEIGPGLWFARIDIHEKQYKRDSLVLVKIDPQKNRFRVMHDKDTKTIEKWQAVTGAKVIFNGSFFRENYEPCALIISDGQSKGPLQNRYMKGMFVAEPRAQDLPPAKIIDLRKTGPILNNLPWNQGLQSFPMLIDKNGLIRVTPSELRASRTAIGTTKDGYILVIHTEKSYFTLYELANFLKDLPLDFECVLNLDGGSAAELCIRTERLNYINYGANYGVKGLYSKIPLVIGVFPRP